MPTKKLTKTKLPKPPRTHGEFIARYPDLGKAWELLNAGGKNAGPLDEKTRQLVKLGIAIGARQEGAVHSGVRKALALGITAEELEQVVALAAGTLGMPATVAAYCWVRDVLKTRG